MKPKLGYIGIGLMGKPMTLRLLAAQGKVLITGQAPLLFPIGNI